MTDSALTWIHVYKLSAYVSPTKTVVIEWRLAVWQKQRWSSDRINTQFPPCSCQRKLPTPDLHAEACHSSVCHVYPLDLAINPNCSSQQVPMWVGSLACPRLGPAPHEQARANLIFTPEADPAEVQYTFPWNFQLKPSVDILCRQGTSKSHACSGPVLSLSCSGLRSLEQGHFFHTTFSFKYIKQMHK